MRVVLAPDKFKGTLTAAQVAAALGDGIRARRPDVQVDIVPVADGGDGLIDACESAGFARVSVEATSARGGRLTTSYVRRDDVAVVELAAIAGLAQLGTDLVPMTASSRGVGEVIAAALDSGATTVVLGIGGSASTDGGAGLVQALGAKILDADGNDIEDGGAALQQVARLDLAGLHPKLARATVEVACDVDNPLTGERGAAAVYGPQKGADADQVRELDGALTQWADLVADATGADHRADAGAGAAGGVGFGAVAVLGAALRPGAELVLDLVEFPKALAGADLVVTGEGSLDEQTLHGKAPVGVASAARDAGVPVVAVAGQCTLGAITAKSAGFDEVYTLLDAAESTEQAFTDPLPLLRGIGARIADGLSR